ncbi:MAG: hypothetical protein A3B99_04175 [Candidatus Yanofskybacteria bacterium RIFCSPHIGHO2_02_FULL_44_12b]|uniref:Cupin type-1 domain-containing protein n=2 Tax=Candidatus Yanofskyibacteriota TaxID=1752733 RepID=A0A1F8GMW7_9BACT|nr:MAG: hypothetical protein UW79_C0019G0019 [Candidatus Yanofskybacteria bacterium GW2011_GWA2_44_9]OGN04623.1 MAG: hypothetical protein A2659_00665 [Candidatus Yanofskybacteria bacterium RIFCSPHIGHO2_01_FULL_44_24]OGN15711.1 MAG: hypothetical protein A3B99_04175 [Candidatus Yanofskybacteria bacterium RIFCSPHIGHO2_02_FULL_44_12b]OGN26767.1 MAG: hypothetical protein A2925_04260 [Candidatus Yanofskybacteria bacterium RIFCSPLOWO2_01_FULL_44_22]
MALDSNKFVHIKRAEIDKALSVDSVAGKRMIPPFNGFSERPFGILEDHQVKDGLPEIHTHEEDLWIGLEGEAIFTLGGELVEPYFKKLADGSEDEREIKGKSIAGGTEVIVGTGDVLWIPAGVPHMHTASGTARLLIYKNPKR